MISVLLHNLINMTKHTILILIVNKMHKCSINTLLNALTYKKMLKTKIIISLTKIWMLKIRIKQHWKTNYDYLKKWNKNLNFLFFNKIYNK